MLTDWTVNTSIPQEGFSGLIERITFHSEETGFAACKSEGSPGAGDGGGSHCQCQLRRVDYSSGQLGAGQRTRAAI